MEPVVGLAELFAVLGAFVGSAFALVRFALGQSRSMADRFVGFMEESLLRQEQTNAGFRTALDGLAANVRDSSVLMQRIAERMGVETWP